MAVPLTRVEGHLRAPLLGDRPPDRDGPSSEPIDRKRPTVQQLRQQAIVIAAVAISIVFDDWGLLVIALLLAASVATLRQVDLRSVLSFGDGFLGYRSHTDWPRGVQEDDDLRWSWPTARSSDPGGGLVRH
jgi:hypothetical protein